MLICAVYIASVLVTVHDPDAIEVFVAKLSVALGYNNSQFTVVNTVFDKSADSVTVVSDKLAQLAASILCKKVVDVTPAAPVIW
jgi:hypothetical protein